CMARYRGADRCRTDRARGTGRGVTSRDPTRQRIDPAVLPVISETTTARFRLGPSSYALLSSLPRQHLPPQHRELAPERAVVNPITHSHYHPAQDPTIGAEMRPNLLAQRRRQALGDLPLEPDIRLARQRDARMN